ncbi:MAG: multidrug effflux MFS transporter [Francisellaceae bacterium]|nr:multidrug effflux MFS transporter [Francisellaceae bacterium]
MEIDVSVPGFPEMATFFETSEAKIQGTLSINFLGFCLACLFFGPLSDSFGRKKMMTIGFFLFCIGSLACTFTNNFNMLLISRFIQGLGASAVWVVSFAIVADTYKGTDAIKFIGIMNAVITGVMAIAPAIGAFICETKGWRATYGLIAMLSFISFVTIGGFLPETNLSPKPFSKKAIFTDYLSLLKNYNFMIHCLAPSILCSAYMAYVGTASFLYIDHLGMTFGGYALHQSLVVATFSIASFKTGSVQHRLGDKKTIVLGLALCLIGIVTIIPLTKMYPESAYSITSAMMFYSAGVALCYGVIFSKSLEIFPDLKGASSALIMGFRVILCGLGVGLSGLIYTGQLYHTAIGIAGLALCGVAFTMLVLQKEELKPDLLSNL